MTYIHRLADDDLEEYREVYRDDPLGLLRLNDEEAEALIEELCDFYRQHQEDAGMGGYAVGLSGGVDSATVAHLVARAAGKEHVTGAVMPAGHSSDKDVQHALDLADELGIGMNDHEVFRSEIDEVVDTLAELGEEGEDQRLKRGNILARCRMIVLRDIAKANGYLVAGTTNASERYLGYTTLAADGKGGVDNEALYNLFKTTVRDLARHLGVPDEIVEKRPTADLWEGQTDRDELGMDYETIDTILVGLMLELDREVVAETADVELEEVTAVVDRHERYKYKNKATPHPSFS